MNLSNTQQNNSSIQITRSRLLFLAILLLPIDGFPLGAQFLREFGSRPVNFILGIVLLIQFKDFFANPIIKRSNGFALQIGIALLVFNFITLVFSGTHSAPIVNRPGWMQWSLQTLMLTWSILSFFLWKALLRTQLLSDVLKPLYVISTIHLIVFFIHALNIEALYFILEFLHGHIDVWRPSGFSTEPSLWSSYVLIIWPLFFIGNQKPRARIIFVALLLASCILSGSRSFLLVVLIQLFFLINFNKTKKLILLLIPISVIASIFIFQSKLSSLVDVQNNLSSLFRLGSSLTAAFAFIDNPFGTGNGTFTYFFKDYAPDFMRISKEAIPFLEGTNTSRASTFNLFLRILLEFGIILSTLIFVKLFLFIRKLKRSAHSHPKNIFLFISFLGGLSFWMQQDQFGYQPMIFLLSLISLHFNFTDSESE